MPDQPFPARPPQTPAASIGDKELTLVFLVGEDTTGRYSIQLLDANGHPLELMRGDLTDILTEAQMNMLNGINQALQTKAEAAWIP